MLSSEVVRVCGAARAPRARAPLEGRGGNGLSDSMDNAVHFVVVQNFVSCVYTLEESDLLLCIL
jgi:hypothetical protein